MGFIGASVDEVSLDRALTNIGAKATTLAGTLLRGVATDLVEEIQIGLPRWKGPLHASMSPFLLHFGGVPHETATPLGGQAGLTWGRTAGGYEDQPLDIALTSSLDYGGRIFLRSDVRARVDQVLAGGLQAAIGARLSLMGGTP